MKILKLIFSSLFGAVAEFVGLWFERKKAKADDWAARTMEGQLQSIKDAEGMAERIRKAPELVKTSKTPGAWNRKAGQAGTLLALLGCLLVGGCFEMNVFVRAKMPFIDAPVKPTLPENPPEWTEREQILVKYSEGLESVILQYNVEAESFNRKVGY